MGSLQFEFFWHWFSGHAITQLPWKVPRPVRVKFLRYWKLIQLSLFFNFNRPAGAWTSPSSWKEIGALQGPLNTTKLTKYFPDGTNTLLLLFQLQASFQALSNALPSSAMPSALHQSPSRWKLRWLHEYFLPKKKNLVWKIFSGSRSWNPFRAWSNKGLFALLILL